MPYKILIFFALFALITAPLYHFFPNKKRYIIILLSSLIFFYMYCGLKIIFLLISVISVYITGLLLQREINKYKLEAKDLEKKEKKILKTKLNNKKKYIFTAAVLLNLGILIALKYFNFFANTTVGFLKIFDISVTAPVIKVILPLGISYYTLQAISYIIDVKREKYEAEKNIFKLGLFITFFPQLCEGPFGRYDEIGKDLTKGDKINSKNLFNGIILMIWGIFKIFVVANRAAIISDSIFKSYQSNSGLVIILGIITFTIQLFAEFSGYIDVARGISRIFNVELDKNFDLPFISKNVSEFWRRWHISLGRWFKDYIFYPVSFSKIARKINKKLPFKSANFIVVTLSLFVVWLLTGLWHGASDKYVVYGLYYFMLMIIHNIIGIFMPKLYEKFNIKENNKIINILNIVKTWILVSIGMLIFRAENLKIFREMFLSIFKVTKNSYNMFEFIEAEDFILLIVGLIILILSARIKYNKINLYKKFESLSKLKRYWICFILFFIVIIFGAYGAGYMPPDPIYGGF